MEKKRDDIKFLFNALALGLVVIAIIVVFHPYMVDDPRLEEVKQVEGKFLTIKPEDMPKLVQASGDKPVIMMLYATWCYYCRQLMPVIIQLMRDRELDGFTPIFISMDTEPRKLSRYLVHRDFYHYFRPYVLEMRPFNRYEGYMRPMGSSFTGTIPYVAFFKNGRMVVEVNKVVGRDYMLAMIARAK